MLRSRLLLRVSRRSSRSRPLRSMPVLSMSMSSKLSLSLEAIEERLDRENESRRPRRRCLGGGDKLGDFEGLLRFRGLGDRDREISDGV